MKRNARRVLGRWAVAAAVAAGWAHPAPAAAGTGEAVTKAAGITAGLCVHLGCRDGLLMAELAETGRFLVHGLAANEASLAKARRDLQDRRLYGTASVELLAGGRLPYADNLVNLLVAEGAGESVAELLRVVCPGGVVLIGVGEGGASEAELKTALAAAGVEKWSIVREGGTWAKAVKPRPAEMDEWTHNRRYDAGGGAVSKDTALGPVNGLRWLAGPYLPLGGTSWVGFRDSNKALISSGGRNFYVTTNDADNLLLTPPYVSTLGKRAEEQPYQRETEKWWRLAARDAHNGLRLWSRSVMEYAAKAGAAVGKPGEPGQGSGPAEALAVTLAAAGERVYGVVYGRVVAIDAATGDLAKVYDVKASAGPAGPGPQNRVVLLHHEGVLFLAGGGTGLARAIDAGTGQVRWQYKTAAGWMAIDGGRVVLGGPKELAAVDLQTGRELWKRELGSLKGGWYERVLMFAKAGVVVLGYGEKLSQGGIRGFHVLSAEDGRLLWSHQADSRKGDPHVARLADGLIWYDRRNPEVTSRRDEDAVLLEGRDPLTGEVKRKFVSSADSSLNVWGGLCRDARPAGTERLLIGSRPICVVDIKAGTSNSFPGRHACGVGVVPANGLLYTMPQACKCTAGCVRGFLAAAHAPLPDEEKAKTAGPDRLVAGPAAGKGPAGEPGGDTQSGWPTFRHDGRRSGSTKAAAPGELKVLWEARVDEQGVAGALKAEWTLNSLGGDRLTAPTVAGGTVFVSAVESHQVVALDAGTGKEKWRHTVGGRLDTPPTLHKGLCLVGSHDGWVYCLRADDGALVWRFRAAPMERRMTAFGQLESVWPVVGGVLMSEAGACVIAGRNSIADGGMYFYVLDPQTGKVLAAAKASGKMYENNILVGVGRTVMTPHGSLTFPANSRPDKADSGYFQMLGHDLSNNRIFNRIWHWPAARRAFTAGGDRWGQVQTFWGVTGLLVIGTPETKKAFAFALPWTVDTDVLDKEGGDLTGWEQDPSAAPEAILKEIEGHFPNAAQKGAAGKYSLSAAVKEAYGAAANMRMKLKWRAAVPGHSQIESLILAGDVLFAGGPLDRLDREKGGILWAFSAADGKRLGEVRLGAHPVSEGLAAAGGRLYVATNDGRLVCLGGR